MSNKTDFSHNVLSGESIQLRRRVELKVSHHDGTNPALVFIHGGLGNRLNWRSQYEFFLNQEREVLAYDLAGHGDSTPYDHYSIGRHRRDLTRLLKRYEVKRPILCCHSYGVPLGLEWAKRNQTGGLILIAGGTHDLDPWWEIPLIKFLAWGGRYLYHLPVVQSLTNRVTTEKSHQKIKLFLSESPIPTKSEPYKAVEIFWSYNFWQHHQPDFSKIPVLVITGGKDPNTSRLSIKQS